MNSLPSLPTAAENYFNELLNGVPGEQLGLRDLVMQCNEILTEIDKVIAEPIANNKKRQLYLGFKESGKIQNMRDYVQKEIKLVECLSSDIRMRDVYAILSLELTDDKQWRDFFCASLRAKQDYSRYRHQNKRRKKLAGKIATQSENLAKLIEDLHAIDNSATPREFLSVRQLLLLTDESDASFGPTSLWPELRPTICGTVSERMLGLSTSESGSSIDPVLEVIRDDCRNALIRMQAIADMLDENDSDFERAWSLAPTLPVLLRKLSAAASVYEYGPGVFRAAISSREETAHLDYVRGFLHLLTEEYGFQLSTSIQNAVAQMTNVVLYDLAKIVTSDDVKKARK